MHDVTGMTHVIFRRIKMLGTVTHCALLVCRHNSEEYVLLLWTATFISNHWTLAQQLQFCEGHFCKIRRAPLCHWIWHPLFARQKVPYSAASLLVSCVQKTENQVLHKGDPWTESLYYAGSTAEANRTKRLSVDSQENTKIVAIRCHILKLKCTKSDFGWGYAPDSPERSP